MHTTKFLAGMLSSLWTELKKTLGTRTSEQERQQLDSKGLSWGSWGLEKRRYTVRGKSAQGPNTITQTAYCLGNKQALQAHLQTSSAFP